VVNAEIRLFLFWAVAMEWKELEFASLGPFYFTYLLPIWLVRVVLLVVSKIFSRFFLSQRDSYDFPLNLEEL
jgi:hypothetical protein